MGNESAAVPCVESTKLRDGPDFQTCGGSFLAKCHFREPLFVYQFCTPESAVAASTHLYELGVNLSRSWDKTDNSDAIID